MSLRLQIILLIFLGIGLAVVVNMVRKRVLELKYVLTWLFADIVLVILVLFPRLIKGITRILGIQSTMNMIFFCGFLLSLMIIFSLTVTISKVTAEVRRMSQTIAMLDKKLLEYESEEREK